MRKIIFVVLSAPVCCLYSLPSFALVDLGAFGGVSQMTEPTTQPGENYSLSANTGKAYGLMAQFHSSFGWGLSVGALYSEVNFHELITVGGVPITNSDSLVPYYQFPVLLNCWFGGILSMGLG